MALRPTLALLLALSSVLTLTTAVPSDWIEYTPGTCNIVISSPHGGSKRVSEIPDDRTDGCLDGGNVCRWEKGCSPADGSKCRASTFRDSYTQEIAAMVVQHLSDTYGCQPHFVRSNVHRSKMDPNREPAEGTQGDPVALEAWQKYHDEYMSSAVAAIRSQWVKGLVFDIHGQTHAEQWTELGYLVSGYRLDNTPSDLASSSIRGLWSRSGADSAATSSLLTGAKSLGSMLEKRGQKVVPGPTYPSPNGGNYFSGGYIVERYGSLASGEVDSIQVEIPREIRFDSARRAAFAADLAASIDEFRKSNGYA